MNITDTKAWRFLLFIRPGLAIFFGAVALLGFEYVGRTYGPGWALLFAFGTAAISGLIAAWPKFQQLEYEREMKMIDEITRKLMDEKWAKDTAAQQANMAGSAYANQPFNKILPKKPPF